MPPADPKLRLLVRHSAAPKDQALAEELLGHLRPLERFAGLDVWSDARIRAGDDGRREIARAIQEANVALLLLSADFFASDGLVEVEVPQLLERHRAGQLRVVPVLLRSCLWDVHLWLRVLHPLPKDGEPVASRQGEARDRVLTEVAREIVGLVDPATGSTTTNRNVEPTEASATPPTTGGHTFVTNIIGATVPAVAVGPGSQAHGAMNSNAQTTPDGSDELARARLRAEMAVIPFVYQHGAGFAPEDNMPVIGCVVENDGEKPFRITACPSTLAAYGDSSRQSSRSSNPRAQGSPRGEGHHQHQAVDDRRPIVGVPRPLQKGSSRVPCGSRSHGGLRERCWLQAGNDRNGRVAPVHQTPDQCRPHLEVATMSMSLRDDFGEPVKRALAARVGNLCSNPDCRALTSGPHEDATKAVNLGVAAHITAAAPGGPRYDACLTPEQRSSIENAIWLCQTCAHLIDSDPVCFPVALLREWKAQAEDAARSVLGKTTIAPSKPGGGSTYYVNLQGAIVGGLALGDGATNNARVELRQTIDAMPPAGEEREGDAPAPLVILGHQIVAEGRRIAAAGNRWTLQLSRFLIGDESALCRFAEQVERLPLHERFVAVSDPDDARLLEGALSWQADRGVVRVEVTVAAARSRCPVAEVATLDDLTEIRGVAAAIYELRYALVSPMGGFCVPEGMGTWTGEWMQVPAAAARLNDLVRLELVRRASVPRMHALLGGEHVSLAFVERVVSAHARPNEGDEEAIPVDVEVVFVGAGSWKGEILVARRPTNPEAQEAYERLMRSAMAGASGV